MKPKKLIDFCHQSKNINIYILLMNFFYLCIKFNIKGLDNKFKGLII